jgi:hypothetical protein
MNGALAFIENKEPSMRTFAIGLLGIVLVHGGAAAQTVQEQDRILRAFQQSVSEVTTAQSCVDTFPDTVTANLRLFTPPVATVFRQVIARTLDEQAAVSRMTGVGVEMPLAHHPMVSEPFPASERHEFPALLAKALPLLPSPLEYRLIGNDLVVRDADRDVIVAVLRDAIGRVVTSVRR